MIPYMPRSAPPFPNPQSKGCKPRTCRWRDEEKLCRTSSSIRKDLERFSCTTAVGDRDITLIHLRNSGSNLAISRSAAKILWSIISNALDWSKLIIVTSVPSSAPSRIWCTKDKLFWVDHPFIAFAQSAWAVEYTDCKSTERWDPSHNECPRYDTKQSDGKVPVMLELWGMRSTPFIAIAPRFTQARSGSTWQGPNYGSNRTILST